MRLRALFLASVMVALVAFSYGVPPAGAGHNADDHSDNVELVAEKAIVIQKDDPETDVNEETVALGSDLAFQKNLMVAGSYEGIGLFRLSQKDPYLKQISFLPCPGGQGDVSIYGDIVFMSVDAPRVNPRCDSPAAASAVDTTLRADWEGVRIISIKNPRRPEQIGTIRTPCGSHTHTLVPAGDRVYLYVQSYPLTTGQSQDCNAAVHRRISIIEVPLKDPRNAHLIEPFVVGTTIGCHDVTILPQRNLAVAACISESQVWDITNPRQPAVMSRIRNPEIQIHHQTAFSWDGKILVLGDEFGGAAAGGCVGNSDVPMGAMWFYDITDPYAPVELGFYAPPRIFEVPDDPEEAQRPRCTTHQFNVVPTKNLSSRVIVSSYYSVALSVIDFSDPAAAEEIGYYLPKESGKNPDSWSAYWYNGLIYTNDHASGAGIRVFRMDGLSLNEAHKFNTRLNPQTQML